MPRREFLQSAPLPAAATPRRPNIVFVFVDDLGCGDRGVTGNRDVPTLHLDSLARSGMRFTQFYAASPVCSPARATRKAFLHSRTWFKKHSLLELKCEQSCGIARQDRRFFAGCEGFLKQRRAVEWSCGGPRGSR